LVNSNAIRKRRASTNEDEQNVTPTVLRNIGMTFHSICENRNLVLLTGARIATQHHRQLMVDPSR